MEQLVDVVAVEVVGDHRLRITFQDATVGDVDFAGREWRGVFEPFRDPAYFARVAVDPESGTVSWPNGVDMAPEPLYEAALQNPVAGTCKGYEQLAASAIPLEAALPAVPARGGEALVRRLFEPLGYDVGVTPIELDPNFPDWGESRHVGLRLSGELRLADLLNHLYVLLPVLDDDKHSG